MSTCSWNDSPSDQNPPIAYRAASPAQTVIPQGTGRHSGSYFDAAGPWVPHLGHSFVGLKGGRSAHDQEHAFTTSSSDISANLLESAKLGQQFRQNYSEGLLGRSKREITSSVTGLYTIPVPEDVDPHLISVRSPSVNPLKAAKFIPASSSTPSVSSTSQISSNSKKREFAREIFDQHGIRRPPGWFSDDEDLSLTGDRTAGHRRFCRICHVCSSRTWSQTHCLSCKHRLCAQCVCEAPKRSGEAHADFSYDLSRADRLDEARSIQPAISTPRPKQVAQEISVPYITIGDGQLAHHITHAHHQENNGAELRADISRTRLTRLVKQNSFIIADKVAGGPAVESHIAKRSTSQQSHYHECSQQHPDDSDHKILSTKFECDDPMCRATHDGHHPYRHSITCALHRSEEAEKCRGSHKLLASDNASVSRLPNPLSNKDAPRPSGHAMQRHHSTGLYHHDDIEHFDNGARYRIHELSTSHENQSVGEAKTSASSTMPVSKSRVEPSETYMVAGQSQGSKSFETKQAVHSNPTYHHGHETIGNYPVSGGEVVNRKSGPVVPRDIKDTAQTKRFIPKGRVLSPPPWLKQPSKEVGDVRSILRPIITKSHGNIQESQMTKSREKVRHPKSPAYKSRSVRDLFNISTTSSQDLIRTSAPSPLTALHITQHQRPDSWLDHSSEHVHSRASHKLFTHMAGTSRATSHRGHSPVEDQKAPSHYGRRPTHLQVENTSYSRDTYLSPSSAHSVAHHSHPSTKGSSHASSSVNVHSWDETVCPESRYSDIQDNTHNTRDNERPPSSSMGRISHSPLQPRQILINVDESTTSGDHTSALASDFEIHRPSPIVPPNHDCNWKDRYLALAAEIRLLKAELATRASLAIRDADYTEEGGGSLANDDDDLGIESVTIIIHLRGRDDLVINTDLTQEPD
ncbi:hypothetical protein F5Y06DRAFT_305808 [Hypoxylon sp. FL0890]|nr:hypothetical protein F5Y06DRAFT_305808 [Hypoxylon sp. FL0890]